MYVQKYWVVVVFFFFSIFISLKSIRKCACNEPIIETLAPRYTELEGQNVNFVVTVVVVVVLVVVVVVVVVVGHER